MKTQVALIGAGRWGKNLARVLYKDVANAELAHVVYTGNPETKAWLEDTLSTVPTSTNLTPILQDNSITHVVIATPIATHFEIAQQCLQAGKHTLVEKPLALNTEEITTLHELAHHSQLQLATGYVYLFDAGVDKLTELTRDAASIDLKLSWEKWGTFDSPVTTNLLVHELAIAHTIMGRHTKIVSKKLNEHLVDLTLQYKKGTIDIHIDREQKVKRKWLEATLDDVSYTLENGMLINQNTGEIVVQNDTSTLLQTELARFTKSQSSFPWADIDREVVAVLQQLHD